MPLWPATLFRDYSVNLARWQVGRRNAEDRIQNSEDKIQQGEPCLRAATAQHCDVSLVYERVGRARPWSDELRFDYLGPENPHLVGAG